MRWLRYLFRSRRPVIRPMSHGDIAYARETLELSFRAAHEPLLGVDKTRHILAKYQDEKAFSQYFDMDFVSLLVAELDGEIVGLGLGGVNLDRTFIGLLYVHPDYQRRGIGQALLLDLIGAHPLPIVELEVVAANTPALGFYRHLGFAPVNRHLSEDGVELLTMRLSGPPQ